MRKIGGLQQSTFRGARSDSKQSITPTQVSPAAQATYLVINLLMSYVDVYTEAVVISICIT